MIDIPVSYFTARSRLSGRVQVDEDGISMLFGPKRSGRFSWSQIQRIAFDDPGSTKASIGAIALLGVYGLGARRTFTLMSLSTADQDMFFELEGPVATWRPTAERLSRDFAAAAGKVSVDGIGTAAAATTGTGGEDVFDQIRKLGELRDAGLITADEFESKKIEMLRRL